MYTLVELLNTPLPLERSLELLDVTFVALVTFSIELTDHGTHHTHIYVRSALYVRVPFYTLVLLYRCSQAYKTG